MNKRRIVITGLGAVTSLGCDVDQIWQNLLDKKSGITKITKFDASKFASQIAGEVKNFDPSIYVNKMDLRRLDLFSQYAIFAAEKAMRNSNIELSREDLTKFGTILGSGMGGVTEIAKSEDIIRTKGPRRISPFFVPKIMINAISAQISMRFGLKGPSFVTAAACSSSGIAIEQAYKAIKYEEADIMITGGSEAVIIPLSIAGFCSARALSKRNDSPQTASRPFDKERDGFVIGEGSGILVLEEFERAKKRGANIYGELKGVASNSDAYHITQPSQDAEGVINCMKAALKNAKIDPQQITYINAHGTSTAQNDKIETLAIKKVFDKYAYNIPISSTKSMIGHSLGATSAIEAIVTVLSIYKNQIHSTANYENFDEECDLDYVPKEAREIKNNYALSNSFAFGGHNVTLVFGKI